MIKKPLAKTAGLLLAMTLVACAAPTTVAPTTAPQNPPTQTPAPTDLPPTTVPPTVAPLTAAPTSVAPTPVAPSAVPPTAAPTAPADDVTRVNFAPGATSASLQGQLQPNEIKTFVVNAGKDQPMIVVLDSPNQAVRLAIYGLQDGQPLVRAASNATMWSGLLPASQDYIIKAVGPAAATTFNFSLEIPHRIDFAPGATSAELDGQVQANGAAAYVVSAQKDQLITVSLDNPLHDVRLTIYGLQDGEPLVRDVSGVTTWSGLLPATQDYIVKAVGPATAEKFHLSMEIAHRIVFDKNAVSATVAGKGAAGPVVTYILKARAGQTLTASLTSATGAVYLTIYGVSDGQPMVRAASDATTFTGKLALTQDYVIKAVQGAAPVDFTLKVTVK